MEKISLSRCKTVLENDCSIYTDDEVAQIREFLYKVAELEYEMFLKQKNLESNKSCNDDFLLDRLAESNS